MIDLFRIARPLIHAFPPELVHEAGIAALAHGLFPAAKPLSHPALPVDAFGLHFKNPIGLAAGFDKNARAIDALLAQGFGFVEAGTVTPKPQRGNPKPRIFRLKEEEAVINRLGFNNDGLDRFVWNFHTHQKTKGVAGANIGKNKDSSDAAADYVAGLSAVYAAADYVTINISSPNTKGLRDLQQRGALDDLLAAIMSARIQCEQVHQKPMPILLKVAPDLSMEEKEDIVALAFSHRLDGLIVSNTTIARPDTLVSQHKKEQGGLSGAPLFALSTQALKEFYRITQGKIPLIGVGGIGSPQDAYIKIKAGATLVQLYTAIIYQGFGLVRRMTEELPALLARDGFTQVSQAVGKDARLPA